MSKSNTVTRPNTRFNMSAGKRRRGTNRHVAAAVALCLGSACASVSFGQTAYFSTQGDFTANSSLQDFFVTTSRTITSAETLRFVTFSSRGTTPNAAGDTSPTIAHNFDSNLTLTNTFSSGTFTNDDGAAAGFLDSHLSWNGVAPNGGGALGTSLSSSSYRLRLNEFNNDIGPWGVDLVGPANAMVFSGFASAGGVSTMRSLKFGTDGVADINAPANPHARFLHNTGSAYAVTGDFVVAQTGNASYVGSSGTAASLTVGGETRVNRGGDITLSGPHILNANGGFIVDGGRVVLNGTSRINVASGTRFIDITNGGRMDVNAGTTFDAPDSRLDLGFDSNATQNLLVVMNGVLNTRGGSIGQGPGSNGRAAIDSPNGRWNMTEDLFVGEGGNGSLEVTSGAKVSNRDAILGRDFGSTGTAVVAGTGSAWTNTNNLTLGRSDGDSTATLTISGNGRINVGDTASTNTVGGFSFIEDQGPTSDDGGVLTVFAGSTLNNTANGGNSGLSVGRGVGRRGDVVVSGTGATINDNLTFVGFQGTGTLTVNAGGKHIANGAFFATSGGTATVTIDGANSLLWSKGDLDLGSNQFGGRGDIDLTNGGDLRVGDRDNDAPNFDVYVSDADPIGTAGGVLTIANGSTLDSAQAASIGTFSGQSGRVVVNGTNSRWTAGDAIALAFSAGSQGELLVQSGGLVRAPNIFAGREGSGTASVSAGGRVETTFQVIVGDLANSDGTATVTGTNSTIAVGSLLEVGRNGTGTLNIQSAGKVTAANAIVGSVATGVGTINLTGTGSLLNVNGNLTLGRAAGGSTGNLTISSGGRLNVGDTAAAIDEGSAYSYIDDNSANASDGGTLFVYAGSTLTNNNNTGFSVGRSAGRSGRIVVSGAGATFNAGPFSIIGNEGTGFVSISAGGTYSTDVDTYLGFFTGTGTVTVDGNDSVFDVNNSVFLGNITGNNGTALSTLTVRNGGRLLVGDQAFGPSMASAGPEGAPLVQVDISDDERDGSEGGLIDIRPGSLLDADNDVAIASEFSSYGRVNVNGVSGTTPARMLVGSDLIVARGVSIGGGGTVPQSVGILNITSGARVEVGQQAWFATDSNALATVTVSGSSGAIPSTLQVANDLRVGPLSSATNASATLNIQNGGRVTAGDAIVGFGSTSVGIVNISGAGSAMVVGQTLTIGVGASSVNLSGGLLKAGIINADGPVNFTGGDLATENFNGNLVQTNGRFIVGPSAAGAPGTIGTTQLIGNYLNVNGRIALEFASTINADSLFVTGTATLDAALLEISMVGGFAPAPGNAFLAVSGATSLNVASLAGLDGWGMIPTLAGNTAFRPLINSTQLLLTDFARRGDVNRDGSVNNLDIAPFVALLTGGRPIDNNDPDFQPLLSLVPEPASLSVLALAGLLLGRRRRR